MDNNSLFFLIFNLNGRSEILDKLMVFGADQLIYLLILSIFILGLKGGIKEKRALLIILLGIPIAILLIKTIHLFFFENRPFVTYNFIPFVKETADASFPSRHATISSVIALSYLYYKSKWSLPFLSVAIWVGLSRIYVGVHYPMDVIGGFLIGIITLFIATKIKNLLKSSLLSAT